MEDGDGDKDLEINSVNNLSSDTYLYLSKKGNKNGKRRRIQEYKLRSLERTQAVSENGGLGGLVRVILCCLVSMITTHRGLGVGFSLTII